MAVSPVIAFVFFAVVYIAHAQAQTVRVAAASDLKFALVPLIARFEGETRTKIAVTLGSSGNLARQIHQGAPFELFMSADEALVLKLVESGHARDAGFVYATGRVALYVSNGVKLALDETLAGVRRDWPLVQKFAIANPEHAPYGRAAQEVLMSLGLWDLVKPKIVHGENVTQAAQFVSTGAAQVGLIALSLAQAPELARAGRYIVLPATLHRPLRQRAALMKTAGVTARALYLFLQSADSREAFRRAGFSMPSE